MCSFPFSLWLCSFAKMPPSHWIFQKWSCIIYFLPYVCTRECGYCVPLHNRAASILNTVWVESGKRHEFFPLTCLSAHHFPPLLSSARPSFISYQFSAGLSRELVSRWSWWKAALWAILSLPCAHGVSLHLTESTKLTGSGRHLNKGVRAQLSQLEFLCDSRRKHSGLIGGAVGEQPAFHHSFAEAQNSAELEQGVWQRSLTEASRTSTDWTAGWKR